MDRKNTYLRDAVKYGLIAGVTSLSICVIGMVALFAQRDLIAGVLTLGQVFLFAPTAVLAYLAARKVSNEYRGAALLNGFITGIVSAIPLVILIYLATNFNLRQFLPNVSPALIEILTFGLGPTARQPRVDDRLRLVRG